MGSKGTAGAPGPNEGRRSENGSDTVAKSGEAHHGVEVFGDGPTLVTRYAWRR
jgi:hypothetical protein